MKVKICGITNLADARMCIDAGADALGFVFYEKSPRFIKPESAADIIRQMPPFVMQVGVFVNSPAETVHDYARNCKLNAVQLHGEESPAYIETMDYPVIKAFRVKAGFDYSQLDAYRVQALLLDTYLDSAYGGTGTPFEWLSIPEMLRNKCILAGGIGSDNIGLLMEQIRPAGVDISSSLEYEPGKKDPEKVRLFFKRLKKYDFEAG